ncbi:aspartate--tRNA(Asn) ligase [Candidatus Parcubacteria bacterium]|uniref:Aspartate--tRNA ligase n=1 Tax=Candidatus Kaiserbacteria bacterium CG10_big_fil_rev_8_21_14_0_10_47_16 TaxID=1974608 RepID=A0A2H0UEA8_9BACT|nr:aspartate--tRNA(Asn) ligase [Candidatus Parcubacteria bacterium]PIR84753.1 MAG: aspartate--tRNA(Asn) ligase [Candidatus Kaiserbacteria bacterium CG10_big_fil_rev_8_21_14_0_10_47_16]
MERTLIAALGEHIGKEVSISGWVDVARDQGKMAFFDFRDRSGKVQGVVFGKPEVLEVAKTLKQEYVVKVTGIVNERPEKMRKEGVINGDIELEITGIEILSEAAAMPFDMDADLTLETLLDNRPLTLRREHERAVFKIQHTILTTYRTFLAGEGFTEFQAPKLVGGDAEGGAEVFKVEYFDGHDAYLATSPQLYKQILVGAFERVFATGATFRAEKSATTRHMSEIAMLDLEMGFIESYEDVMALVTKLMGAISSAVANDCAAELALLGVPAPLAPDAFPTFTLREAQELIKKETGEDKTNEPDLEPEDERFLCEYAAQNLGSDFVFITQFPTSKRPFYTAKNKENPEFTDSFDLLFRGLEMCSGSQRVHNYDELVGRITEKGLDPTKFEFYLQAFKYGLPPHGGIGMGLERLTMKMAGLVNVKEASLFPRDMNRIDTLLSKTENNETQNDD